MNHWMQTRQYTCPRCQAAYLHDKAYHHALFRCPKRAHDHPIAAARAATGNRPLHVGARATAIKKGPES